MYFYNMHHANITAFSTTREGGCSKGTYATFNANWYCGDDANNVEKNRTLLCKRLGIESDQLIIPHQTHQTTIEFITNDMMKQSEEEKRQRLEGVDAVATDLGNVCVCVSTADCIPILVCEGERNVVAAIHAGWRGTVERIAEKTIASMVEKYGMDTKKCHAVIGPGISMDSFEVGDEVYDAFVVAGFDMNSIARRYPIRNENEDENGNEDGNVDMKWHIDLWECNRQQLINAGLKEENVSVCGICTFKEYERFFSARRLGLKSGRILNGIMIRT